MQPPLPSRPPREPSETGLSAGYIPWWMLLVTVIFFGVLFVAAWGVVLAGRATGGARPSATAIVVLIFPTAGTPGANAGDASAGTPQPEHTPTIPPAPAGIIALGDLVKVVGTGGDGLRLRVGPGLNETPNYLALESEVLIVQAGPTIADGYTWWFLVDPADDTRNGWAVENYLEVVNQ